jgi:ABC-type histidine transport system ATPase subunit
MSGEPILAVRGLTKHFGRLPVLKGVDLTVFPGDVVFIIGPSGGGKSTLLRCINFLERPASGSIIFAGKTLCSEQNGAFQCSPERDLRHVRAQMPMVFQHFNLFKHRTILGNVIEGPVKVLKRPRQQAVEEATKILKNLGLGDKLDAYPAQLSGGQQQRVGIARALAMRPQLILFDEPTSSLDPELVSEILDSIRRLAITGMTMIVVTHEMAFARNLAHTIHFMADGVIVESGPPDRIFNMPHSERLKTFISLMLD